MLALLCCLGGHAEAATATVSCNNYFYNPQNVTINLGDSVIWTNNSGTTHTATSTTGLWDSGSIASGTSYTRQFNTGGVFAYQDSNFFAQGMTGTVTVVAPPVVTSPTTANGTVGANYAYAIIAPGATSYSAIGLPAGLGINATTGVISGIPTTAAPNSVTVTATNSAGSGTATIGITIALPAVGAPVISSPAQPGGSVGNAFQYTIVASNAPGLYTSSGQPSTIFLDMTTGIMTGTPTVAGVYDLTVAVTNGNGSTQTSMVLTITSGSSTTTTGTATATTGGSTTGGQLNGGGTCGLGGGLGMLSLVLLVTLRLRRAGAPAAGQG